MENEPDDPIDDDEDHKSDNEDHVDDDEDHKDDDEDHDNDVEDHEDEDNAANPAHLDLDLDRDRSSSSVDRNEALLRKITMSSSFRIAEEADFHYETRHDNHIYI